jgi:aminoglycoside phosphotransferase (APT) family kinase protein
VAAFRRLGLLEYQGVPRLDGTPSREETVDRYEQMSGRALRNLRYNEVLAAVAIGIPISRLGTRLRNEGLLTGNFDLAGFCVERIRQLLG